MTKQTKAFSIIILTALNLFAGSMLAGKYPFGLSTRASNASSLMMGGIAVGMRDPHNVLIANPGNLGLIKTTAFSSLLNIDYLRINEDNLYSDMITTHPSLLSFSIPIGRVGTLGFGMSKDHLFNIEFDSKVTESDGSINRASSHVTGGTTSWEFGYGFSPFKMLSFGLSLQRIYHKKEYTYLKELDETPITRDSTFTMLRTYGLTAGYMGTFKDLTVGASFRYIFEGDAKKDANIYNYAYADPSDTDSLKEVSTPINSNIEPERGKIQMPADFSLGLSYKINKSFTIGTDLKFTLWHFFKDKGNNGRTLLDYTGIIDTKSVSLDFSTGLKFIPKPNLLYPKYWETIHYMIGFNFQQLPVKDDFEISGSGGLAFPLKNAGQLEIGFKAGSRILGNPPKETSDYKENFVSLKIGLSGGKRWRKSSDGTY